MAVYLFRWGVRVPEITGDLLDPDKVLANIQTGTTQRNGQFSKRQQTIVRREMKKQADPLEKPGMVGAFCRAYSITEAIDTFLTDVYKHSAMSAGTITSPLTHRLVS